MINRFQNRQVEIFFYDIFINAIRVSRRLRNREQRAASDRWLAFQPQKLVVSLTGSRFGVLFLAGFAIGFLAGYLLIWIIVQ